jgi:hypothetical protein
MQGSNARLRLGVAIGALVAVAAAAAPSMTAQAAGPTPAQTTQHDALIQAAGACHQLALFQINQGLTDAQTTKQSKEAACKSEGASAYPNGDCFDVANNAYKTTTLALQQQQFVADGVYKKETDAITYAFTNVNACPQACSTGMRQIYTQPVASLSCAQLATMLNATPAPAPPP